MRWYDCLEEVEAHVRAIDKAPPSLDRLREAIEMIAAARSANALVTVELVSRDKAFFVEAREARAANVSVTIKESRALIVKPGGDRISVYVDGDVYVEILFRFTDSGPQRYANFELLAWRANGILFLPRHCAAVADRLRREGGDESRLPVGLLAQEQKKEYVFQDRLIKRLEPASPL
jgi:hypothetical protein